MFHVYISLLVRCPLPCRMCERMVEAARVMVSPHLAPSLSPHVSSATIVSHAHTCRV